jgi:hypothetical protein
MDQEMVLTFETRDDALMQAMMKAKTWGTEQGSGEYQTRRSQLWEEVTAEYMPATSTQDAEV